MSEAPIVIHRTAGTGGRRVTIRAQVAGLARSDNDVIEFLRRAGLPDAGDVLDDPRWVQWQDGRPHKYGAPSVQHETDLPVSGQEQDGPEVTK